MGYWYMFHCGSNDGYNAGKIRGDSCSFLECLSCAPGYAVALYSFMVACVLPTNRGDFMQSALQVRNWLLSVSTRKQLIPHHRWPCGSLYYAIRVSVDENGNLHFCTVSVVERGLSFFPSMDPFLDISYGSEDMWHYPVSSVIANYSGSFSILLGTRVGEASNPGPESPLQLEARTWRLQIRNVISAASHADELFSTSEDCVVWSETCATESTLQSLTQSARLKKFSLVHSAAVASRTYRGALSTGRGVASGSLILSKFKARHLHNLWPSVVYSTGRISDALICLGRIQLRVIAAYGYHSNLPDAAGLNELLLDEVFSQAHSSHVPTLIAGDLNINLQEYSGWNFYMNAGFQDLGLRFADLADHEPEMTYRGISRLDYCVCNRSAAPLVSGFVIDPRGYTDHASIHVDLQLPVLQIPRRTWKMPVNLQSVDGVLEGVTSATVPQHMKTRFIQQISEGDMTSALHTFAHAFEASCSSVADGKGIPLQAKYFGRANGKFIQHATNLFTTSSDGSVLTDQRQFRCMQQALRRVRELHRSLQRTGRFYGAQHCILWEKILASPGFKGGFAQYLLRNDLVSFVPQYPDPLWISQLLTSLTGEEKLWVQAVRARQYLSVKNRRMTDWARGGRLHASHIKPPAAAPLTALAVTDTLTVRHQRAIKDKSAVFKILDGPIPLPGSVWQFPHKQVAVVKITDDIVTLATPLTSDMAVRQVKQLMWCSDVNFLFSELGQYWDNFWYTDKSPNLEFVQKHLHCLPALPGFDPFISVEELDFVIRKLKCNKARGMDGFSNEEIKALSADLRAMLLLLFNEVIRTACWPDQLTRAIVSLLSKIPTPVHPSHARPINILPSLYRLWAKCVALKIMKAILPHLPHGLCGSVPGKSSLDLAWLLQSAIEESLVTKTPLTGVSIDLSKAYNLISRDGLQLVAHRLGWPQMVIDAYLSHLRALRRHFAVDGCLSDERFSSTGVPEGCPVAVVSMIAITWFVGNRLQFDQLGQLVSFVDNWTVQQSSVSKVLEAVHHIHESVEAFSMTVALDKLRFYSTDEVSRKKLRASVVCGIKCKVYHDFQDLGVFFCAAKRSSSKLYGMRFQRAQPRFQKLSRAPWSDFVKAKALVRFVLPAVLYGCELTHFAASSLRQLRGRCSSALWGSRNQRDHWLSPLVSSASIFEPFLLILARRWNSLQRALRANSSEIVQRWNLFVDLETLPLNGPVSLFLEQIYELGWSARHDGIVVDQQGFVWDIRWDTFGHAYDQILSAWVLRILPLIRKDEQFDGIEEFQIGALRKHLSGKDWFNTVLANYSTGAIMSSRVRAHFLDQGDASCSLCGLETSAVHILYRCPGTQSLRDEINVSVLIDLPNAQRVAGFFPVLHGLRDLRALFAQVPVKVPYQFDDYVHLFTDGSTFYNTITHLAVSSWSVVLAETGSLERTVVESSHLRGLRQTNDRAELQAVLYACQCAPGGTVYSDSKYCVDGFLKLQSFGWLESQWSGACNTDLWHQLWTVLRERAHAWSIVKVASHRVKSSASSAFDLWCITHNDYADEAAKAINRSRPPGFWPLHQKLLVQHRDYIAKFGLLHKLQQSVANTCKLATSRPTSRVQTGGVDCLQWQREQFGMLSNERRSLIPCSHLELDISSFVMCGVFAKLVWQFLIQQYWVPDPLVGISILELYVAFVQSTGWVVPINISSYKQEERPPEFRSTMLASRVWAHETQWTLLKHARQPLTVQVVTFRRILSAIFSAQGITWDIFRSQSLKALGASQPLASLAWRPFCTLDGSTLRLLQIHKAGSSFSAFMGRPFAASRDPVEAPCPMLNVDEVWRCYTALFR